jgi:oligoribonuclease NrnB/cAMP/cGMP phosphodiesterase (DHH superfamily)
LQPINYSKPFPFDIVDKDSRVWILDCAPNFDEMVALYKITSDVVWIDHHVSAIKRFEGSYIVDGKSIPGVRQENHSACVLTWNYLFSHPAPMHLQYIEDIDIWNWKYGNDTRFFYAGACSKDTDPTSDFWDKYTNGADIISLIDNDGKIVERYRNIEFKEHREKNGYEVEWEGYKCFVLNTYHAGSDDLGGEKMMETHPILISYYFNGENYMVSLYSKDINVSEIATKNGGGGHRAASGFKCKKLPWK